MHCNVRSIAPADYFPHAGCPTVNLGRESDSIPEKYGFKRLTCLNALYSESSTAKGLP